MIPKEKAITPDISKKNLSQALLIWILVIVSIRVVSLFDSLPFIYENLSTLIAVLLIYPPVLMSLKNRERIIYWQMNPIIIKQTLKVFFLISLIIFPAAFLVNHFYQSLIFKTVYHQGSSDIWAFYIFFQLFLVAFPEEFFFRGFLQGVFTAMWKPRYEIFGIPFGLSHILVSLVFALSHSLIMLQWWHLFIFFPGLVFSWLKEKTGTIWAAVLFHWCCNLFAYWVAIHY